MVVNVLSPTSAIKFIPLNPGENQLFLINIPAIYTPSWTAKSQWYLNPAPLMTDPPQHKSVIINLFDSTPYKKLAPMEQSQDMTTDKVDVDTILPQIVVDTVAPRMDDKFQFDWPSEEIKAACEAMLPKGKDEVLPTLDWIAPEKVVDVNDQHQSSDAMEDVQ